ncbi:MAG: hypothetical protein ACRDCT_32655, partial [Shewanella sp.]
KVKKASASSFQCVSPKRTIVICDKENLTIELLTDPNDPDAAEIIGKAEFSKELQTFGINVAKYFSREQLIKLIRFNRRFFPNKEENANLLSAYQSFTASVNKNIQEESDLRGNKNNQFQKKVNTTLPENFVLEVPIFKGEKAVTFPVEICMEDYDSGIRFWFESVDLAELIATKTDELFDRELESCKEFAIIFK